MTREEMKKMLPIIQAYVDGKTVEYYNEHESEWVPFDKEYSFFITFFDSPKAYRIKPEPKYRPFKDAEECWNEMLKHQPFGWIKGPFGEYAAIDFIDAGGTARHGKATWDFKESFDDVVFADGTPFGIKEGGEE
jgi:hypothetical protein